MFAQCCAYHVSEVGPTVPSAGSYFWQPSSLLQAVATNQEVHHCCAQMLYQCESVGIVRRHCQNHRVFTDEGKKCWAAWLYTDTLLTIIVDADDLFKPP
jgi:hypothetical protein